MVNLLHQHIICTSMDANGMNTTLQSEEVISGWVKESKKKHLEREVVRSPRATSSPIRLNRATYNSRRKRAMWFASFFVVYAHSETILNDSLVVACSGL